MLIQYIFSSEKIRVAKEKVLGIRHYKSKKDKYFNIPSRILAIGIIFVAIFSFSGFPSEALGEKESKKEETYSPVLEELKINPIRNNISNRAREAEPKKFALKTLDDSVIEIGTKKHFPSHPYFKLNKWDGEISFKIEIPYNTNGNPEKLGNKLRYSSNKRDIDFYPTKIGEKKEIDVFEIEVILKEKPKTNKVEFIIEKENLDLRLITQKDLIQEKTQELLNSGQGLAGEIQFNPNHIDSIIAENRKKRDKPLGIIEGEEITDEERNYITRRAFRILRPKIKDSNGWEVFGKFELEEGLLKLIIPQEFLNNAIYPIFVDPTIDYGSEATFNSANTKYISISTLDSTHFVVGYRDDGGDDYGHCKIGTVSGSTISYGSEYVFNSADTYHISVSALDSTHFVVGYRDHGGDGYGHCKIGTVSGSTISYGSEYVFNSPSAFNLYISALDSTHFVVGYWDTGGDSYGHCKIGTVSGSAISYGSEATFNSAVTSYISISALDSTHFVVGYKDSGNSSYGTAIIGTVSGSAISYGSEATFNSASTDYISVSALDSTYFVVSYRDVGNSSYGTAIIGTVSGSTISYGSEYVYNSAATYFTSVYALDSTSFAVGYCDAGNSSYGTGIIGMVSGSAISYSDEYVFNSATTYYLSNFALDPTHFVVGYQDGGNSNYGTGIIGTYTPSTTYQPRPSGVSPSGGGLLIF